MTERFLPLSDKMIELVARRFRAMGDPTRLRILQFLESGEMSVGALTAAISGNQPNISKHLYALYESGLVARRRVGNNILYSIADSMVLKICELVCRSATDSMRAQYSELVGRKRG